MVALSYDLQNDFTPLALVCRDPLMIVASKNMPDDLKAFVAWLKANPGRATQAVTGAGGVSMVGGLFFQKETGVQFRFVPYRTGLGAAMLDLVAGQIDFMMDTTANSLPQVRAGAIKAYAITAMSRLATAPEIPTVDEAGLPGFHFLNWQAAFLPRGTPANIVASLNAAIVAALAGPAVRRHLADIGQEVFPDDQQTPEALAAFQKAEIERMWPLIKTANVKSE